MKRTYGIAALLCIAVLPLILAFGFDLLLGAAEAWSSRHFIGWPAMAAKLILFGVYAAAVSLLSLTAFPRLAHKALCLGVTVVLCLACSWVLGGVVPPATAYREILLYIAIGVYTAGIFVQLRRRRPGA